MVNRSRLAAAWGLALVLAGGLQACSGNTGASGGLEISSYGPDTTQAGVVFNKQPDGGSAIWIRVNRPLDGDVATVVFRGKPLTGAISGNLVTAAIPADLYREPGSFEVHVVAQRGAVTQLSNSVKFTVR